MTFIGTDKQPGGGGGTAGGPCTGVIPLAFGAAFITATTLPRWLLPAGDFGGGTAPTVAIFYRVQAPGSLTRFQLRIVAGAGNGLDIVYTVNLNGVPIPGYSITLASTAAGDFAVSGPAVALVDGDTLAIECTKDSDVGTGPAGIQAFLRIEDSCPGCCPPAYLSQRMFDAYAEIYISGASAVSVDLDASLCGQGRLLSVVRPSAFAGAPGTPPVVVTTVYDPVLNIVRVTLDATLATDGRYVLEISNACQCCVLIPLEGVSI